MDPKKYEKTIEYRACTNTVFDAPTIERSIYHQIIVYDLSDSDDEITTNIGPTFTDIMSR